MQWNTAYDPWKNSAAVDAIADRLTEATAEVEHIESPGALLQNTCIGQVLKIIKHPNADKLSLCDVKTDKGTKKVVCGGINVREGMFVAFAHIGATVRWHGGEPMTLAQTKIRGEESEGMICAAEELGLREQFPESTGRNIIELMGNDLCIGRPLKTFLGLDDIVFHIDNHAITHRPDLFSHTGFARECVALEMAKWQKVSPKKISFPKMPVPFRLHIEEKHLMPRYSACVIELTSLGKTPDWMKRRLTAVGWRSVNLPVDITNFVASEIGVPLHSFDLEDIKGDVHMRKAREGEKIQTLDTKELSLPEGALVLSDDKGIFDLLGIMGGLRSSTKESTRRIYLHAASLDPVSIRRTVIATGHRTDAATVYEKGVPHITTEMGFFRAVALFLKLIPGARIASRMESVGHNGKPKSIPLSQEHLERTLGTIIPPTEVHRIFTNLGFKIKTKKATHSTGSGSSKSYSITPPLWRLRDISAPHDCIEEVARIIGYNQIPSSIPISLIAPPARDHRKTEIRLALRECGFWEVVPSPFISPALLQKCGLDPVQSLSIENPLGEETSLLQPSLLPQLLTHAEKNILYSDDFLQTFTIAHVFTRDGTEHEELGLLVVPKKNPCLPDHPILKLSSYIHHTFRCAQPSALTLLHPTICEMFGLSPFSAYAGINLTEFFRLPSQIPPVSPLPVFPAITYDLTLPWNHQKPAGDLLKHLQSVSPLLENVAVQDLFSHDPNDRSYNLTIRCTYRSAERTLTENEVRSEHDRLTKIALAL